MSEKIEPPVSASSYSGSAQLDSQNDFGTKDAKVHETIVAVENIDRVSEDNYDERNPFSDPEVASYYATMYEKSQYECRHVFDPTLEWTAAEEKKLVRKLDWHVCLWAVSLLVPRQDIVDWL
jgi:hypothetical protein